LSIKKHKGPLLRFLLQFHQALVYILLVAIGLNDWVHIIAVGLTIHIVIDLDKTIRLYLERRTEKTR